MNFNMKRKAFLFCLALILITATCTVGCVSKKNTKTTTSTNTAIAEQVIYIRYANVKPTADSDVLPVGQIGPWMGISVIPAAKAPTDYTAYNWAKIQGNDGIAGAPGKDGINGIDGKDGLSAYEIYLKYASGTTLSEEEWLKSLQGKDGQDAQPAFSGHSVEITEVLSNGYICCNINEAGASLYLIHAYCTVPTIPSAVTIEYSGCSACTSVAPYVAGNNSTRYFVEKGNLTVPGEQIILSIPVTPRYKNYFETEEFNIRVNGLNVEFCTIEEGNY